MLQPGETIFCVSIWYFGGGIVNICCAMNVVLQWMLDFLRFNRAFASETVLHNVLLTSALHIAAICLGLCFGGGGGGGCCRLEHISKYFTVDFFKALMRTVLNRKCANTCSDFTLISLIISLWDWNSAYTSWWINRALDSQTYPSGKFFMVYHFESWLQGG